MTDRDETGRARDDALAAACAWLDAHLDQLAVSADPRWRFPSLKALGELGQAGEILTRRADPAQRALGDRWLDHAWHALGDGAIVEQLIAALPRNVLAATLLPPFARTSRTRASATAQIARQLSAAPLTPAEWAYVVAVARSLGLEVPAAAARTGDDAAVLRARPLPWTVDLDHLYQLTHEVFYVTDWALHPDRLPADAAEYLHLWLPCWLEHYATVDDSDLLAELILVGRCARQPIPDRAWARLAGAQRADGAVRPPEHRRVDWGESDVMTDDFARHHHATLVAVMAWAA